MPIVKFQRDPRDRRYPERLAGSALASIVLHVLLALLLVSLVFTSSQEGATENVEGGSIVTLEQRTPAVASQSSAVRASRPVAHVPRIAPVRQAAFAQPQTQRLPQNRHELARQAPTAPPNPRELTQQSPQPNPAPTQNVYEVHPSNESPAAPVNIPTVAPVAVAIKTPPSAAPSPVPTAVATPLRSPRPPAPTAAPTLRASPAPAAPSPARTAAPVVVRASAAPKPSAAPAARSSAPPAPRAGVPSPSPTLAAAVAKTRGTAPSPGPKGQGTPGPRPGGNEKTSVSPARPIELRPTPSPAPHPTRRPVPDINGRLRSMLPNNPVRPTSKQYSPPISLRGSLEPTPPPSVLAQTKYLYRTRGIGNEARVEMWVTSIRKEGPTTICTGWLVRYPFNQKASHPGDFAPANGTQVTVGGGRGTPAMLPPVVDGIVTLACEGRLLEPYAASPAASP